MKKIVLMAVALVVLGLTACDSQKKEVADNDQIIEVQEISDVVANEEDSLLVNDSQAVQTEATPTQTTTEESTPQ